MKQLSLTWGIVFGISFASALTAHVSYQMFYFQLALALSFSLIIFYSFKWLLTRQVNSVKQRIMSTNNNICDVIKKRNDYLKQIQALTEQLGTINPEDDREPIFRNALISAENAISEVLEGTINFGKAVGGIGLTLFGLSEGSQLIEHAGREVAHSGNVSFSRASKIKTLREKLTDDIVRYKHSVSNANREVDFDTEKLRKIDLQLENYSNFLDCVGSPKWNLLIPLITLTSSTVLQFGKII
jgi:hypothetical protein